MRLWRVIFSYLIIVSVLLMTVAVNFAFAAPGTSALVGYWKLDETTQGASAVDSSGYGNAGTGVGTGSGPSYSTNVPYTTFPDARSASFNGFNQYIDCGTTPSGLPSGSQARTIAAWIKATSFADAFGKSVVGWGNDSGGELSEMEVSNSHLEFHGNGNDVVGASTLSTGQWYHLAVTVTSGGAVTLYVNGVQDGTGSVSLSTTEANCKIGRQPDFNGQYFNGLIDDVRIYSRVLSPSEIANLAAGNESTATWTGTTSTDFETASNWNINLVPEPFTKFIIPSTTNSPVLSANEAFGGVNIQSGAVLNLNGYNLTMGDVATNSGTIIAKNSETVSNFSMPTNAGTVLYNNTSDATGLSLGNSYYNLIFNDGLVGYYKLDETSSGSTSVDSSGYGNNGTSVGTTGTQNLPQPSSDIPSVTFANAKSYHFDGTDDVISMANGVPESILGSNPKTVVFWTKPQRLSNGYVFLGVGDGSNEAGNMRIMSDSNGFLKLDISFGVETSTLKITTNTWQNVAVIWDGTNWKMCLNGVCDTLSSLPAAATLQGQFDIGRGVWNSNYLQGYIDDVRVYDRALSAGELTNLSNGSEPSTSIATTTLDHDLAVNGSLVLNSGTLDVSTSSYNITDTGNFENNGGVFTARNGTVTLNAVDGQTINSSNTFYNLIRSPISSDHLALTFGAGSTQTIKNTLSLNGTNGGLLGLFSSTSGTQWKIDPQGTRNITYAGVWDSNNINSTPIAFSSTNTYGTNLTNWETSAPTPTPTPTPTSGSSNNSFSSSSSNSSAQTCSVMPSIGAPDLYQLDPSINSVTLYFSPPSPSISAYTISYGTSQSADMYAVQAFNLNSSSAVAYTVNDLLPGTTYYFKVEAQNGCTPSSWSSTHSVTTKSNVIASYLAPFESIASVPQSSNKKITIKKSTLTTKPTPKTSPHTVSVGKSTTPTPTPTSISQNLYSVDVTVKNGDQPVVGATVTMHSVQKQAITDGHGVAHFTNVEKGEHTVMLAYQGYTGQQHVTVTGANKDLALTLQIQLNSGFSSPAVIAVIAGMAVIILVLILSLYRKRNSKL